MHKNQKRVKPEVKPYIRMIYKGRLCLIHCLIQSIMKLKKNDEVCY